MTKEVRCPQCGTPIQIDGETYDSIARQVRDLEFKRELDLKYRELEESRLADIKAAEDAVRIESLTQINAINAEYKKLQTIHQNSITSATKAVMERDAKITELSTRVKTMTSEHKAAIDKAIATERNANAAKDIEITRLSSELEAKDREYIAIMENTKLADQARINELLAENEALRASNAMELSNTKEKYNILIQAKDDEIARIKEFRSKQTVKLIGESLEAHCVALYTSIQSALPNASFTKDNTLSEDGTKGDFIYREVDQNGSSLLSIMYELKNESEDSVNKHKNEDFLKKLDKDRNAKGCEYAVLVTTLEPDSEVYNQGIVDMSNRYPKMFVIRPQFFLSFLLLLRSLSMDKTDLRNTISELRAKNIDATNLENDLNIFREAIAKCHTAASNSKDRAIAKIDKIIQVLQDIKDDLTKMDKHVSTAEEKAEKLTIGKLEKRYPAILGITPKEPDKPKIQTELLAV